MADISVIIPMYNVRDYIEECLSCLLRQGDVDLEVIIIDDGSTDGSAEIARRFSDSHPGFRYYRNENSGTANARNFGVGLAGGKYLAFLDSDDVLVDGTYERMFAKCEREESELGLMCTCRFSARGTWKAALQDKVFDRHENVTNIRDNHVLLYDELVTNKLILRSFYQGHGFMFPEGMAYEDIPVGFAMHLAAKKVSMLDRTGYLWRFRESGEKSITQRKGEVKNLSDRFRSMAMIEDTAAAFGAEEDFIRDLTVKFFEHDLLLYINMIPLIDEADGKDILKMIGEWAEGRFEFCRDSLRVLTRRKYELILAGEYEKVKELVTFGKMGYSQLEVRREGNTRRVMLPSEYFDEESADFSADFNFTPTVRYVHRIIPEKDRIIISGYIYKPRLEVRAGEQKMSAKLVDSKSGTEVPLYTETSQFRFLNTSKGVLYSRQDDRLFEYDYLGATFKIEIDAFSLGLILDGSYSVLVDYENDVRSGTVMLTGISAPKKKMFDGMKVFLGGRNITVRFEALDQLVLDIRKEGRFLRDMTATGDAVIPELSYDAERIGLRPLDETLPFIELEREKGSFHLDSSLAERLEPGAEYVMVSYPERKGRIRKIPAAVRKSRYVRTESGMLVLSSLIKAGAGLLMEREYALLENSSVNGGVIEISLSLHSGESSDSAVLFVDDELSPERRILGRGDVSENLVKFRIDFTDSEFTKDLYASNRTLMIDVSGRILHVYAESEDSLCTSQVAVKTFGAALSKDSYGRVSMNFLQIWPKKQNRFSKRQKVVHERTAELKKQEIKKGRVLFQSSKRLDGPAFQVFDELKGRNPDLDAVLALDDVRLPIDAKRVRKSSLAHYRMLYQSQFIISDMELSPLFRKRKDQTWILLGSSDFTRADRIVTGDVREMADEIEKLMDSSRSKGFIKRLLSAGKRRK